ncbi:MAG: homoserine O-acetyltransferase, partial [Porticoccaceae bacterium]|nr:homoserine O-acetyltransferase [Porticoccaceae bacterium]
MSLNYGQNSVGLVTAEKVLIDTPLTLACGTVLPSHELMVETYGCLNT